MSASEIIKGALQQWGLTELYGDVDALIKEGLDEAAINVRLQQTEAYKRRFVANEQRIKAGLAVLSPAEYLGAEAAYRQVMQSYGIPAGLWDSADDFTNFLAKDVSPEEINDRVKVARDAFLSADEGYRQTWREFYGLSDGAGIAAILDPERAMPVINRMVAAARAGSVATRSGLEADRARLEGYVDQGYTADQLTDAFQQIGAVRSAEQGIAARFGQDFSQAESEQARLGMASAARKQRELYGAEQALFEARPGADKDSLSRRSAGSY